MSFSNREFSGVCSGTAKRSKKWAGDMLGRLRPGRLVDGDKVNRGEKRKRAQIHHHGTGNVCMDCACQAGDARPVGGGSRYIGVQGQNKIIFRYGLTEMGRSTVNKKTSSRIFSRTYTGWRLNIRKESGGAYPNSNLWRGSRPQQM